MVALLLAGQNNEMMAFRFRYPVLRFAKAQRQFGPEYGFYRVVLCSLSHTNNSVETVMIRQGKSMQPQPGGLL
jgi:hypothetical protein